MVFSISIQREVDNPHGLYHGYLVFKVSKHYKRHTYINDKLCNYLVKKLCLEDFMTPQQFLVSLCKIAFGKSCKEILPVKTQESSKTWEDILEVETLDDVGEYPLKTFKIKRTHFEVFQLMFPSELSQKEFLSHI